MKLLIKRNKKLLLLSFIVIALSCNRDDDQAVDQESLIEASLSFEAQKKDEKVNVFKGPEVQYGEGKARSWITINKEGFPVEIGIELTSGTLKDRTELATGHEETTVLPLHHKAKELTPFEHIGLNYQPGGHGPVFWSEHIDFHFYTITNEERLAIPAYDPKDQQIVDGYNYFPDMTKMPEDYLKFPDAGGAYPKMGKHWVPKDFQTGYNPFTHVMILGSYEQKNNFIEPMVTIEFLLSGQDFGGEYSQPETFEEAGNNYPAQYNIYHDETTGNIYVSLSDFITH